MKNNGIIELITTFVILTIFIAFAFVFGMVIIITAFCLALFVFLRSYYLRWKYGKSAFQKTHTTTTTQEKITIIDAEYKDVSDKK